MNVEMSSALVGSGSGPEVAASPSDPATAEASFVAALLEAFGLDGESTLSEWASGDPASDSDTRLLELLSSVLAEVDGELFGTLYGPDVQTASGGYGMTEGEGADDGPVGPWFDGKGSPSEVHAPASGTSATNPAEQSYRAMGPDESAGLALGKVRNEAALGAPAAGVERPDVARAHTRSVDRAMLRNQTEAKPRSPEAAADLASDGAVEASHREGFDVAQPPGAESSGAFEVPADGPDGVGAIDLASEPASPVVQAQERPADVERADASLNRVAPELRERIERVISRMRDEFGHHVTVVEGYRSPDRQAHIYQQGRGEPGEIVTWTRRSWHTEGLAADLEVDGSYDDRLGYARLQRIAREEGLRTLGSRDLGHVELPNSRVPDPRRTTTPVGPPVRFVGVATPAAVAAPASVSAVAQVAAVAMPGSHVATSSNRPDPEGAPPVPAAVEAPVDEVGLRSDRRIASAGTSSSPANATGPGGEVVVGGSANRGRDRDDHLEPSRAQRPETEEVTAAPNTEDAPGVESRVAPDSRVPGVGVAARPAGAVESLDGPSSLDRIARIQELRDLARGISPSRVSLRLDGDGSVSDRLRISLLNRSIDADLDIADPVTASLIRGRVSDLHRALEARGLGLNALALNGVSETRAGTEGWLASPSEAATELLRTLFGSAAGDSRGSGDRERSAPERRTNQDGPGSDRARRETEKEHERDR